MKRKLKKNFFIIIIISLILVFLLIFYFLSNSEYQIIKKSCIESTTETYLPEYSYILNKDRSTSPVNSHGFTLACNKAGGRQVGERPSSSTSILPVYLRCYADDDLETCIKKRQEELEERKSDQKKERAINEYNQLYK